MSNTSTPVTELEVGSYYRVDRTVYGNPAESLLHVIKSLDNGFLRVVVEGNDHEMVVETTGLFPIFKISESEYLISMLK